MFSNPEKFSAASKSFFESQFAAFNALATKAVADVEKAVALNIATAKTCAEDSVVAAKQLIAVKDPQAFFALAATQGKEHADKVAAYGRQLTESVSSIKADFTKTAEAQMAESKSKVFALVDEVSKNAPAGSEKAVEMLKSVIGNVNAGYDQLSKTSKQAVEAVEAQVTKATEQLSQVVNKAA